MKKRSIVSLFILFLVIFIINNAKAQNLIDLKLAQSYFEELKEICNNDNGSLWGVNFYGPTLFVFDDRQVVANHSFDGSEFSKVDQVFIGTLPEHINMANTSFEWNGVNWTMLMWNSISANDPYSRKSLLAHESWHRIQNEIGIQAVMTSNAHLDEFQGSVLLKIEFMALRNALIAKQNSEKEIHIKKALTVRKYRQILFPENNENQFERHEGMAEYTGYKLSELNSALVPKIIAKRLELAENQDGFANSFAYISGPAYGFLLDELKSDWLDKIKNGKNIPDIFSDLNIEASTKDSLLLKSETSEIILFYKAESLIEREKGKFELEKELINTYIKNILEADQLIIKNNNLRFSFNPQEKLIPIANKGVIYKTMRVSGEWGILDVKNGVLRTNDWQLFIVKAPISAYSGTINEMDYTLILNNDWEVTEFKKGKFTITKKN